MPVVYIERAAIAAMRPRPLAGSFLGLYVTGALDALAAPVVAIVGTRAATPQGRERARTMAHDLARRGVCVISGLALGIDGAAHEGALAAGAPTIGVLGGGHDAFFPRRHRDLGARMIAAGGAVASPYPPDWPARPGQFLARNAIVAALADAIVVIEAGARSGALNTATWGAEFNVPVLALPGDVDRPKSAGCLALIRDGALLVRDADDVLAALPSGACIDWEAAPACAPAAAIDPLTPLQRALVGALADGELALDALVARSGAGPGAVGAALLLLELHGQIEARGGTRFALRRSRA